MMLSQSLDKKMGDQFLSMHEPAAGVLSPKRTDGETIEAVAEEKNRVGIGGIEYRKREKTALSFNSSAPNNYEEHRRMQ